MRVSSRSPTASSPRAAWSGIETGRLLASEAELARFKIPDEDLKIEVKRGGRWVDTTPG